MGRAPMVSAIGSQVKDLGSSLADFHHPFPSQPMQLPEILLNLSATSGKFPNTLKGHFFGPPSSFLKDVGPSNHHSLDNSPVFANLHLLQFVQVF